MTTITTITATSALVISIGNLAFSVYQYRILHKVRISEKATSLMRVAKDLRLKSDAARAQDRVHRPCTRLR